LKKFPFALTNLVILTGGLKSSSIFTKASLICLFKGFIKLVEFVVADGFTKDYLTFSYLSFGKVIGFDTAAGISEFTSFI
jgi:hypothetical protein